MCWDSSGLKRRQMKQSERKNFISRTFPDQHKQNMTTRGFGGSFFQSNRPRESDVCLSLVFLRLSGPHHSVCRLRGLPPRQDPGLGQTQWCHFLCQVSVVDAFGKKKKKQGAGEIKVEAGWRMEKMRRMRIKMAGERRIEIMRESSRASGQWVLILFALVSSL